MSTGGGWKKEDGYYDVMAAELVSLAGLRNLYSLPGLCSLQSGGTYVPCRSWAFLVGLDRLFVAWYGLTGRMIIHANHRYRSLPSFVAVRWEMWTRVSIMVWSILCSPFSRIMVTHTIDTVTSVLTQREIIFSQLSVLGAAKVIHFKIMCRVLGYRPSLGTFRRFYVNFISNGWMSFSRRGPTPCCLSKKFDSLKNLNDHFFWIYAFICPISVPWHTSASILKDPILSNDRINAELLALLDHHHTIIRWYPEMFLCLVGLSRSFDDVLVRPTLLRDDGSGGSFMRSGLGVMRLRLLRPLPLLADGGVRAHHASMGIVVSSSSGPNDEVVAPRVEDVVAGFAERVGALGNTAEASTSVPDVVSPTDDFYDSQTVETATADNIYHTCMIFELRLRYEHEIMTRKKFQKKFTDTCAVVQQRDAKITVLRTRLEEAEREDAEVVSLRSHISELEAEVAVKSQEVDTLGIQNAELLNRVLALESECGELKRHVIKLGGNCERLRKEVVGEAKLREEFKSFQDAKACRFEQKSVELDARIADVRRDMDNDMYPYMFIAIAGRRRLLSHGVRLAVMKQGLEAGIKHGRSERTLAQVEAYNPRVKDNFVSAVTDFENVSFGLLDELKLLKDSPLASIMSALVLKDAHGNVVSTPELQRFQPSLDQVTVLIYSGYGFVSGKVFLSEVIHTVRAAVERRWLCPPLLAGSFSSVPPPGSSLGVADYQVLSDDEGPATQPPIVQAHDDLFDTSVLDNAGA
nr:putative transposase (putative), gypsy type [Tanacetum cinerariifolium]